jgi:NitT/TauT family transport system substrate-binding protein
MKKIIALIVLTIMLFSLVSCNISNNDNDTTPPEKVKIRIGYMAGPTGMGMAKLIHDNGGLENGNDKYSFTKYADTQAAKTDLAAGKIDIICLPTNEAAQYANSVDKNAKVLAINCLNSLYLVCNTTSSFKEDASPITLSDFNGKTIYTCKNGTPRIVIEYLIQALKLNITVSYEVDGKEILTPNDLATQVIAGNIPNAVMPEPIVTNVVLKTMANSHTDRIYSPVIDLADEWTKVLDTPLTMGCIIADGDFARDHKDELNAFLEEYKASVEYIGNSKNIDSAADYVVETGVMGAAPAAKMALNNLGSSISYIDGDEMKTALVNFYKSIGIVLPDDSFYYEK